jgi:hypothetical protein
MTGAVSNCSSTTPPDPAYAAALSGSNDQHKQTPYQTRNLRTIYYAEPSHYCRPFVHHTSLPFPTFPFSKPLLKMAVFSAVADIVRLPWIGPVLILISVFGIAVQKYRAYLRLAHFQGPPGAAWTELWLARVTWQSRIHTTLRDVNEKYGTASGQSLLNNTSPPLLS